MTPFKVISILVALALHLPVLLSKALQHLINEIKVVVYQLALTKEGLGENNPLFKMDKDAFCDLLLDNKELLDADDVAFLIDEHKKRYQATSY